MIETSQITCEILDLIEEWENKLAILPGETITERRNSQICIFAM